MLLINCIISSVDGTMMSIGRTSSLHAYLIFIDIDVTNFTCVLILYGLSRNNLLEYITLIYPVYLVEICWKLVRLDLWTP